MELMDMIEHRRSIRSYTGEPVPKEALEKILQAGLLAPSGHNYRAWEFMVVQDKETLAKLADFRTAGAKILAGADTAIVVLTRTDKQDVWAEDCSAAMMLMHLMADSLGVGSCWIQGRLRVAPDGGSAEACARRILGFPEDVALEAILCLGMPAVQPEPKKAEDVDMSKVHWGQW